MRTNRRLVSVLSGIIASVMIPQTVFAEDCSALDENEAWNNLFNQFNAQYTAGAYEEAIKTTQELQTICSKSPILNFSIAGTYHNLGDDVQAKEYIRIALEQTNDFAVSPRVLESMWMMRYEIEACDKAEYDKLAAIEAEERQKLEDTTQALKVASEELEKRRVTMASNVESEQFRNKVIMWTGTGIGAAGLVMLATGAALAAIEKSDAGGTSDSFKVQGSKLTIKPKHYATWTLLGAGIAATVAGGVMAGLGAYYYTHQANEDIAFQFSVSPTNLNVSMVF